MAKRDDTEITPSTGSALDFITAFEGGDALSEDEIIDGFQHLIDSGTVWQLQGSYGRTAVALIEAGHCHA